MAKIINHFDCNIQAELVDFFEPLDNRRFYYPGACPGGGSDGVIVRFQPASSQNWTGVFAFGRFGHTGTYVHPNCEYIMVISKGDGYIINPNNHMDAFEIPLEPSRGIQALSEKNLLFLHDSFRIACFDIEGLRWRIAFEMTDEIRFCNQSEDYLFADIWLPGRRRFERAQIDIDTGKCINSNLIKINVELDRPSLREAI